MIHGMTALSLYPSLGDAMTFTVNGVVQELLKEAYMEFAVEAQKPLAIWLEGGVV